MKRGHGSATISKLDLESNVRYLDGLAKFLSLNGNTLLIKGYAGAGKTTLSLQLLQQLARGGNAIYVSSRVSEQKVGNHLPWVRDGKISGQDYEFLDIRLGTASSVLEELTSVIDSHGRGRRASIIVLDTWDALAKEMEDKERLKAEKMLIAMADSSNARIIFVSEEPGRTTMDYLVDGIIELVRSEEHERIFREVEVQKMRGTLIDQHKYLYTLLNGVFRHLPPYAPPTISEAKGFKSIPDLEHGFSFGSHDLDAAFGGLRKGSTFAFEYDEKVPYSAIRTVEATSVINALNVGHGVFMITLPGAALEDVASLIQPFVTPDAFKNHFAIASMYNKEGVLPPFYGIETEDARKAAASITEVINRLRANSERDGVLVIESVGQLGSTFASNTNLLLEGIASRVSKVQQKSVDAMILLLQSDSQIRSRVLAMCRGYARLFVKDRSVVLLGEKPATEAFVLEHSEENSLIPKLTRIV